jgi:hypothetical protein
MYLIHAMLIRGIFAWIVVGPITTSKYRPLAFWITLVPWCALLLFLSRLWRDYVDGFSIRVTKEMETWMSRPPMGRSAVHKSGTDLEAGQENGTSENLDVS